MRTATLILALIFFTSTAPAQTAGLPRLQPEPEAPRLVEPPLMTPNQIRKTVFVFGATAILLTALTLMLKRDL